MESTPPPDQDSSSGVTTVVIPDIFESFMARAPVVNPHYDSVNAQALKWASEYDLLPSRVHKLTLDRICGYTSSETDRMRRGDFAYFGAVSVPDAEPDKLKTIVDWLNWVCLSMICADVLLIV